MSSIVSTETHERRHSRAIDRHELRRIVSDTVCAELGIDPKDPSVEVVVKFEDDREGTPSNHVGTKALVNIVEDLADRADRTRAAADRAPSIAVDPPGGQISGT